MQSIIKHEFSEHTKVSIETIKSIGKPIEIASNLCIDCLNQGNKILIFGNGGSAADAQHIAAEFVNKFCIQRPALAAIALTTDTSILTSIANDESYDAVFSRQVEALAKPGDVVIGISTSGHSENVIRGLQAAKSAGARVVGLSGRDGGAMNDVAELNIVVPHDETCRIQEVHILIGHILCDLVDAEMYGRPVTEAEIA